MMMDFTEAANAVKLGPHRGQRHAAEHRGEPGQERHRYPFDHAADLVRQLLGGARKTRRTNPSAISRAKRSATSRASPAPTFSPPSSPRSSKLDIEKDFQNVPAETGALIALLERGDVEAINMFEPHTHAHGNVGPLPRARRFRHRARRNLRRAAAQIHRRHAQRDRREAAAAGQSPAQRLRRRGANDQDRTGRRVSSSPKPRSFSI